MSNIRTAPRIGMGCWAIGGMFWKGDLPVGYSGTNDKDSIAAVHAAWAAGVRVFDTSAVYGAGHSETLLGEALNGREDAIIVSKFGHSFDAKTKQMTGSKFDAEYIRNSVAQSRKRLKRDQIDVMLLHLNALPIDDAMSAFDTLEELRADGQIKAFGWSTDFPENVSAMAGREGFAAVQHVMNLFFDAPSLSTAAEEHDLVQLIRSPLAMGILTGNYSDGQKVPDKDVRRIQDGDGDFFNGSSASETYVKQLEAVRDLITVGGRSLTQGALCWLLAKSPNTLPIPGAKNAAQAEENAGALVYGPLPADIMAEIEGVLKRPPEGAPRER